jgi:hypothetical protein
MWLASELMLRRSHLLKLSVMCCGWALCGSQLLAQSSIVRIEEHWELEIKQADALTNAPQVMMHFSPFGNNSDFHFEVDINHASVPSYQAGGLQVRAMQGSDCLSQVRLLSDQRLNAQSEILSWTQIAQKQEAGWAFAIGFGNSDSWGAFGGAESIVALPNVDLPVQHSAALSLQSSGVIYAKNRVHRLTLRSVRYYDSSGQSIDLTVDQSVE